MHVFARNLDAVQTSVSRLISLPRNRLRNERFACGATGDFESESSISLEVGRVRLLFLPFSSCLLAVVSFPCILFLGPRTLLSLSFTLVAIFFAGLASRENIDMWREQAVEITAQHADEYEKSENGEGVDYVGDLGVATHFGYDRRIGFGTDFPVQDAKSSSFRPI